MLFNNHQWLKHSEMSVKNDKGGCD